MKSRMVSCAKSVLATLVAALLFAGCADDGPYSDGPEPQLGKFYTAEEVDGVSMPPGGTGGGVMGKTVDLSCRALRNDCRALAGVTVEAATGDIAVTDEDGVAELLIPDNLSQLVVKFSKEGFETEKRLLKLNNSRLDCMAVMSKGPETAVLETPGDGGTVTFEGGSITFGPNSFWEVGSESMEAVNVKVRVIDVTSSDIVNAPGDFSAITASGDEVWLQSFGMLSVELTNSYGTDVPMTKAAKAKVEMLVPEGAEFEAGRTIPAWHFDEQSQKWIEEGHWVVGPWSQDKRKQVFSATVSHFSWWNCDEPMEVACIKGRVVDCEGEPVVGASIAAVGIDYWATLSDYTDSTGHYCVLARVDSEVNVSTMAFDEFEVLTSSQVVHTSNQNGLCGSANCQKLDFELPCSEIAVLVEEDTICIGK